MKPQYLVSLLILLTAIYPGNASPPQKQVLHVINRLSFGPSPGDIEQVQKMGIESYIKQQLSPESIPESPILKTQLQQMPLQLTPVQLYKQYTVPPGGKLTESERQAIRKQSRLVFANTQKAKLLRAIYNPRQLEEVMVDFWYNHFNVHAGAKGAYLLVGAYERDAIRPHAFGHFRDLLAATARHPAMLTYLDNRQNKVSQGAAKKKMLGLNENYARELMELHTLGVDGGYTQADVVNLARIFSGWGITRDAQQANGLGFRFNERHHDFNDKIFLQHTIKASGEAEGEQALDILARHPATARHISYKLAQYFVNDHPSDRLIKHLSERYLATDGDIRAVLDTLFHSPEFWDSKNYNAKFKTPYQYVVSAVRATGVEVKNTQPLSGTLNELGMPLYNYPAPTGYKNTQAAWLNPEAINRRLSFATNFSRGVMRLSQPQSQNKHSRPQPIDAAQLVDTLGTFSEHTQRAIASSPPELRAALILGSPEFMYR